METPYIHPNLRDFVDMGAMPAELQLGTCVDDKEWVEVFAAKGSKKDRLMFRVLLSDLLRLAP